MAKVKRAQGTGEVSFNMTPLIDIVFNLIIFFMLVSQFQELDKEPLTLPHARTSEVKDYSAFRNVVINLVMNEQDVPVIKVQGNAVDYRELTGMLKDKKRTLQPGQELNVILRADQMVPYEDVARVMLATGRAEVRGWWVATEQEKEQAMP